MHTQEELLAAVALLKEKLKPHRGENITGAQVGEILVNQCGFRLKHFDGPKLTLSHFITAYLSDTLNRNGIQGGDLLYLVSSPTEPLQVQPEYRYWLAFAKVDEPNQLAIRNADKQPVIVTTGENIADAKPVQKATLSDLEEIKGLFVNKESTAGRSDYPRQSLPYVQWIAELRRFPLARQNAWGLFRIEQLKSLFTKRLEALDVDVDDQGRLVQFLSVSQASKPAKMLATSNPPAKSWAAPRDFSSVREDGDQTLRHAVIDVIKCLSTAELRELKLPVGLVMDALQARLGK
ncbi:hypothetical protein [Pseudomonas brassicacearum]|uniref:hypothetical protein n=1 Tax=Pseudomonas brassicacearum TaxID=930166 RepID=UPI003ECDA452